MRIVGISDTHLAHQIQDLAIPEGDILIHAGDATNRGTRIEIMSFNRWFSERPHRDKIFVAGNHDWLFDADNNLARSLLDPSICYLEDSEVFIKGLRIYGSPWTPVYHPSDRWAFNVTRGEKLKDKWKTIPRGLDILITHCPPYLVGDEYNGRHAGCADLGAKIKAVRPRLHIFGHIHSGYGIYDDRLGITYANASICNADHLPVNRPIVIDL